MPRKGNSSVTGGSLTCIWSNVMDDALIDAYVHQQNIVNRVGGTFTSHALDCIVNDLKEKFPDMPIDKERVQNHMKNKKRQFTRCYDIFKNGMSGFSWDPINEMWIAEPEVWSQLIEHKPEATDWRNKSIKNYEKMVQLFSIDRATGQHAEIASEMRQRRARCDSPFPKTVEGIDDMVRMHEVILEDFDIGANSEPEAQSTRMRSRANSEGPSSTSSKRSKKSDDEYLERLTESLDKVANSIIYSTNELVHGNKRLPIQENEIWDLIENLNIDPHLESKAYIFLVQHPEMLRALISCPERRRKSVLMDLLNSDN